jgi:hypothetical protein
MGISDIGLAKNYGYRLPSSDKYYRSIHCVRLIKLALEHEVSNVEVASKYLSVSQF